DRGHQRRGAQGRGGQSARRERQPRADDARFERRGALDSSVGGLPRPAPRGAAQGTARPGGLEVRRARRWPVLMLGALLASCASSPPTQFYTLEPVQPCQPAGPRGAGANTCAPASIQERTLHASTRPIQLAPVRIPAVLERQEIVTERGSNELLLSNRHRWGAPLGEMARRTLTQDLLQRLQGNEVVLPEQPAPANTREIVVDILR